jgi:cell cycle related kinase
MIIDAIEYIHSNHIIHRDIKPSSKLNIILITLRLLFPYFCFLLYYILFIHLDILLSRSGQIKIADFGLARVYDANDKSPLSHQVATRWYRAPELLFASRYYDQGVDMWSVAVVICELIMLHPLFPGMINKKYIIININSKFLI